MAHCWTNTLLGFFTDMQLPYSIILPLAMVTVEGSVVKNQRKYIFNTGSWQNPNDSRNMPFSRSWCSIYGIGWLRLPGSFASILYLIVVATQHHRMSSWKWPIWLPVWACVKYCQHTVCSFVNCNNIVIPHNNISCTTDIYSCMFQRHFVTETNMKGRVLLYSNNWK